MLKEDLLSRLSEDSGVPSKQIEVVLKSFTTIIREEVLNNADTINIVGLGTFKQFRSAATTGRNPKTGATLSIPAKVKVKFKASPQLVK